MKHKIIILIVALVFARSIGIAHAHNTDNLVKQNVEESNSVKINKEKEQAIEKHNTRVNKYYVARLKGNDLFDNNFLISTRQLLKNVDDKNYNQLLTGLKCVDLPDGLRLDIQCCERKGWGNESKLYVEDTNGQRSYNIFNYLKIEQTAQGAWEALLLYELWHILPLWWHANYASRKFIFDRQDIIEVSIDFYTYDMFEKEKHVRKLLFRNFDLTPRVYKLNNSFYVSYCYWSDWYGLVKECIEVKFDGEKVVGFHHFKAKHLYKYNCQIIY